jgi:hypothetical protein
MFLVGIGVIALCAYLTERSSGGSVSGRAPRVTWRR